MTNEQKRQYRNMAKTASWTMVSRITGLVRDQVTTAMFGAGHVGAAFLFAFQIPNLFRRLLGEGALTAATVPVLAAKTDEGGRPAAFAFLNYILRRMLPWMLGLTLLAIGVAWGWLLLATNLENQYAAELTIWCMPYMPIICIAALFTSAVNLCGKFGLAEIASSCLNLCMILGVGFFGYYLADSDIGRARWLCVGAIAGGTLQLLIPLWGLKNEGWRSQPVQADVKAWNALKIAFIPAALGAGILQVNFLISRSLAFNVDVSGLTYYYIANRIVELPIGLFSTSIATVIFPAMATAHAQNDLESLGRNFSRGMRLVLAINLAAAAGFIVFSGKIIKLLFEFGRFTAIDCERTEIILLLFALAMPFHALISIVTRALNVMGKTQETFRVAMISVAANIVLSMIAVSTGFGFHGWTGVKGLALANAFAAILQFVLLRRALRQTSDLFFRESLVLPTCQTLVGSLLMGALAYQSFQILFGVNQVWLGTKMNLLISLAIATGIGAVFYAMVLYGWKYPERDMFQPFVQRIRRLFKREA